MFDVITGDARGWDRLVATPLIGVRTPSSLPRVAHMVTAKFDGVVFARSVLILHRIGGANSSSVALPPRGFVRRAPRTAIRAVRGCASRLSWNAGAVSRPIIQFQTPPEGTRQFVLT